MIDSGSTGIDTDNTWWTPINTVHATAINRLRNVNRRFRLRDALACAGV
jgi:hypothetical protein